MGKMVPSVSDSGLFGERDTRKREMECFLHAVISCISRPLMIIIQFCRDLDREKRNSSEEGQCIDKRHIDPSFFCAIAVVWCSNLARTKSA